jgi:hypothetical protein
MEMFDTHRRDILNFDTYMDLKKPGFGGPASAMQLRDGKGKLVNDKLKLSGFQRTVERDPAFSHPVYDPTYKAMTGDLVYKQEGKKAFTYDDSRSGIPVVEIDPLKEGKSYSSFQKFINEAIDDDVEDELEDEADDEDIYDPIAAAHAEYESPADRRYMSDDWVAAQQGAMGIDDEEEEYAEAASSNRTMSGLRQIEDKLRSFEQGGNFDEEEEEFGANPSESPFGPIPDWIKELEANREDDEFEYGANPGECSECGDSDWMK